MERNQFQLDSTGKLDPNDLEQLKQVIPEPYYLQDDTIRVQPDEGRVTANVVFPSTDRDIRPNHVNVGSIKFAAWNAAHILFQMQGLHTPRITDYSGKNRNVIRPDTEVAMELDFEILEDRRRLVIGALDLAITDLQNPEKLYAQLHAEGVIRKARNQ